MNQALLSGSTPDWLRQRAVSTPDRTALIAGAERLTFGELDRAVDAACVALGHSGPFGKEQYGKVLASGR